MLTFKQIDALYWTASLGSFSSADEKFHTTQSAITKRIKELEAYFQVEVFNRSSKKVVLTPKGEEVYQLAIDLINKRDSILYKLTANNMLSGTLRLGVTEITSITWLPNFIHRLNTTFPNLAIIPKVAMNKELAQGLVRGTLDIAIVRTPPRDNDTIYLPLQELRLAWVGGPSLISPQKIYSRRELPNMPIIRQPKESGLNDTYDKWFSPYKPEHNIFTIHSLFAMIGLATANLGITCIPIDFCQHLTQTNQLVLAQVKSPVPAPMYSLAFKKEAKITFLEDIYNIAKETCNFTYSSFNTINV